jgi:hypothetical protein
VRNQEAFRAYEREIKTEWRGGHDDGNAEDESYQNSASKCGLKKLHKAFHVSCTLSNPSRVQLFSLSMAAQSLKHDIDTMKYGGNKYGARTAPYRRSPPAAVTMAITPPAMAMTMMPTAPVDVLRR